jgi:hypothetical protein
VAVAAELAQQVAVGATRHRGRCGHRQRAQAGVQRAALWAQRLHGASEQIAGAVDAGGLGAENADELGDGTVVAGLADGGGVGERPAVRTAGDDRSRVEHGEGGGDHFAGHLPHHRTAAGEVGNGPSGRATPLTAEGLGVKPRAS